VRTIEHMWPSKSMERFLSVERSLWKLGLVLGFLETTAIRGGFFPSLSLKSVRTDYLETFKILTFQQPSLKLC